MQKKEVGSFFTRPFWKPSNLRTDNFCKVYTLHTHSLHFKLYILYTLHFTLTSVKYPQKQVLAASSVCRSGERTGTGLGAQAGSSGEGGKVTSTGGQMYQ